MKVGYVIKSYPRLSQTFIVNEILAHEAAGLELEIFSLRPARDEERHGSVTRVKAPVHYLPGLDGSAAAFWHEAVELARYVPEAWTRLGACAAESASDVHQALALARRVREHGITHLHAHFGNVATSVARLAGFFAGVPYSFTAHARDIFHEKVVPAELARKLADARAVVTVSDYNLAFLNRNYGAAAQTVRRIYNGLDLGRFGYAEAGERDPVIVSVGRLIDKKGFEDLIDACALLKQRGREFLCVIIGSGPLEEALKARIARLGLGREVRMVGSQPQEDVMREVQSAAAFAAPCVVSPDGDRDGLPTVLLEAMALGTPCVSTNVTGIPEILHDGETGLMVGQHDAAALAEALERLLGDAGLRRRLAQNARRLMETQFDIHSNAARMRDVFAAAAR
jgi:glycosyltransferase involved in cell wall biosynthesis